MLIFKNPCPQGPWKLLLGLSELDDYSPLPSTPYRSCLHPIPSKTLEAGDLDSSANSATDPVALAQPCPFSQCLYMYDAMWGGDQTPPASPMAYNFYLAPRLPSILLSRPMAGPLGRTGEQGGRQWILSVLFFKEKYSLFRAYGNFSERCALFVHLFVTPEYRAARMGPEIAPMLSSEAQLSEGRSSHRLDSKILFEVLSLIPGDGWGRM